MGEVAHHARNLGKHVRHRCMRAFITDSRKSAVTMSRRRESSVMRGSAEVACNTWLRVRTSSPTRFIIRLSREMSTRRVLSAAEAGTGAEIAADSGGLAACTSCGSAAASGGGAGLTNSSGLAKGCGESGQIGSDL
jgi:hypothetical protein